MWHERDRAAGLLPKSRYSSGAERRGIVVRLMTCCLRMAICGFVFTRPQLKIGFPTTRTIE